MPESYFKRLKVPPTLRINIVSSFDLGDNPSVIIINPRNVAQPKSVSKTGNNQYTVVCDPASVGETVDLKLVSAKFSVMDFCKKLFFGIFFFLSLSFWKSLLPGGGFWSGLLSVNFKTFFVRTFMFSGVLFICLVGLNVSGVEVHKPFSKWLDTFTLAESSGDRIRQIFSFDTPDPFFGSQEADDFLTRTGKTLDKIYVMTTIMEGDTSYRMLIRKVFLSADDLDAAEDICEKELNAEVPSLEDYYLIQNNEDVRSELELAFAEWTSTDRGILSDDLVLFLPMEHVETWHENVKTIKNSAGESLKEFGEIHGVQQEDMDDDEFKRAIISQLNKELRLPNYTDIEYDEGTPSFYLDADHEANFRCVRKLEG